MSRLAAGGWTSQILISHDICSKHRLRHFGGHGYDHIPATVVPAMLERGFTEDDVHRLTVDNPRRALQVA